MPQSETVARPDVSMAPRFGTVVYRANCYVSVTVAGTASTYNPADGVALRDVCPNGSWARVVDFASGPSRQFPTKGAPRS